MARFNSKLSIISLALAGLYGCGGGDYSGGTATSNTVVPVVVAPYGDVLKLSLATATPTDINFESDENSYVFDSLILAAGATKSVVIRSADNSLACGFTGELTVGNPITGVCAASAPTAGVVKATQAGLYHFDMDVTNKDKPVFKLEAETAATAPVAALVVDTQTAFKAKVDASSSTDADSWDLNNLSYEWDFGDSSASVKTKVAEHTYAKSGKYTLKLTVTDLAGLTAVKTQEIQVNSQKPVAAFTGPTAVTLPAVAQFDASTSTDDIAVVSYLWDFGDNKTSTEAKPSHTYAAGTYSVKLTVADADGQTASKVMSVAVTDPTSSDQPPVAKFSFTPNNGQAPTTVNFDASTSTDDKGIKSYTWDFGDNTTATGATASHQYTSGKLYSVKLTVTDSANQSASLSQDVTVTAANQAPVASFSFSPASPKTGETVNFSSTSTDADGSVKSYSWTIDNTAYSTQNVSRTFATAGTYKASLKVTDDKGAISSEVTKDVVVVAAGPVGDPVAGLAVYKNSCAVCHDTAAFSAQPIKNKKPASESSINNAIKNQSTMTFLAGSLNSTQLINLAAYINSL